jgi:DNA primase
VVIVEGEKTADVAETVFTDCCVVTWSGGCLAADKTDWSPLRGRKVLLVPDADEPGKKAMHRLARKLSGMGCSAIKIVDPNAVAARNPDGSTRQIKKGWDIADAVAEGWSADALRKTLDERSTEFNPRHHTDDDKRAGDRHDERANDVVLTRASQVAAESIDWLWPSYLARGKLHILAGKPSAGKTTLAIDWAGSISSGRAFRDEHKAEPGQF